MENKINIAELLKDCPKGMELDCAVYDNCTLKIVFEGCLYPIQIQTPEGLINLTKYGSLSSNTYSKCVIFPKGKTTWDEFEPPCKFKDGDIIFTHANCIKVGLGNTWISIYQEKRNGGIATYVDCAEDGSDYYSNIDGDKPLLCFEKDILRQRLATKEEKQKLFKAIKEHGYKWNAETKTLEKLIEPKFKIGDRIRHRLTGEVYMVLSMLSNGYGGGVYDVAVTNEIGKSIDIKDQDNYELVPNKFDISTLKPFDKVLVRCGNDSSWTAQFFVKYRPNSKFSFVCTYNTWTQCIPYEGNEHLLGKTDECDEFYKTWEQ